MKTRSVSYPWALFSLGLVMVAGLAMAACAAAPSRQADAAAAPEEPKDEAASAAEERTEGRDAASSVRQPAAQEPAGREDGESAAEEAPAAETAVQDPLDALAESQAAFEEALRPEALSCESAKPRRDAICSIAERICDGSGGLSSSERRDCEKAQRACEDAKSRYQEVCGS